MLRYSPNLCFSPHASALPLGSLDTPRMIKCLRQCQRRCGRAARVSGAVRFVRYLCQVVFIKGQNETHMSAWLSAIPIISAGVLRRPLCYCQRSASFGRGGRLLWVSPGTQLCKANAQTHVQCRSTPEGLADKTAVCGSRLHPDNAITNVLY